MKTIKDVWFSLPPQLRRQWWAETEYGRRPPNKALIMRVKTIIDARAARSPP
jgi:hypothetical protein